MLECTFLSSGKINQKDMHKINIHFTNEKYKNQELIQKYNEDLNLATVQSRFHEYFYDSNSSNIFSNKRMNHHYSLSSRININSTPNSVSNLSSYREKNNN